MCGLDSVGTVTFHHLFMRSASALRKLDLADIPITDIQLIDVFVCYPPCGVGSSL